MLQHNQLDWLALETKFIGVWAWGQCYKTFYGLSLWIQIFYDSCDIRSLLEFQSFKLFSLSLMLLQNKLEGLAPEN
jgi:hypothetical protein